MVTTRFSDWATNYLEYKVAPGQVSPWNGPSDWQAEHRALSAENRRIELAPAGE